jgi:hypothetical protein
VYDDGSGEKLYVTANNGWSGFELYQFDKNSAPLPVELASFEATQTAESTVRLSWTTTSEQNNAGFRVERRHEADGSGDAGTAGAWEKVGYMASPVPGGTSDQAQSYTFTAESIPVGDHQFRLKQVDLDGSTQVHNSVTVEVGIQQPVRLSAPAPNPVRDRATVSFAVKDRAETRITLYSTLGQRVRTVYRGTPTAGEA